MDTEPPKGRRLGSSSKTIVFRGATNGWIQITTFSGITDLSGMIEIGGEPIKRALFIVLVGGTIGMKATGSRRGVMTRRRTMLMMARSTLIRIGHPIRSPLAFRGRCKNKGIFRAK